MSSGPKARHAVSRAGVTAAFRRMLVTVGAAGRCRMTIPADWASGFIDGKIEGEIAAALHKCWLDRLEPTQERICTLTKLPAERVRRALILMDHARRIVRTVAERGVGRSVYVLNPTKMSLDGLTLASVVRSFLTGPASRDKKRAVRTALRLHLGLPGVDEGALIDACEEITLDRLQTLPELFRNAAEDREEERTRNQAWAVRLLLKHAIEMALPLVFSCVRDPWHAVKDEWLPLNARPAGISKKRVQQWRLGVTYAGDAASDLWPGRKPSEITPDDLEEMRRWHKARGRRARASTMMVGLRAAGRLGHGPLAGVPTEESVLLSSPETHGALATTAGLVRLMGELNMPPEWTELLTGYADWSLLDIEELELRSDLPVRPVRRRLNASTWRHRLAALRVLLGISKRLKVDLTTLTLEAAFSLEHVMLVVSELRKVWKARAEAGQINSPYGGSIRNYVLGIGMWAEALYRKMLRAEGVMVSSHAGSTFHQGELRADRGAAHRSILDAYVWALAQEESLRERAIMTSVSGSVNTDKDLIRILQNTPAPFWIKLLDAALAKARQSVDRLEAGETLTLPELRHIRNTYILGFFISTGFRLEELVLVQLGLQYVPETLISGQRRINLRACDRKNQKQHTAVLDPRFVPEWLENAYINHVRDPLVAALPADDPLANHSYLIVRCGSPESPGGRPYYEGPERGTVFALPAVEQEECSLQLERAKGSLRLAWQDWSGSLAYEALKVLIPLDHGEWGSHAIRAAIAHAIFQAAKAAGRDAASQAANYLGDDPQSVLDTYATTGAQFLTSELCAILAPLGGDTSGFEDNWDIDPRTKALKARVEALEAELQKKEAA